MEQQLKTPHKKKKGMQDGGAFLKSLVGTPASNAFLKAAKKEKTYFCAKRDANVSKLWEQLISHKIQAVVIVNQDGKTYNGMLDESTIVEHALGLLKTDKMDETFFESLEKAEEFKTLQVKDIMEHPLKATNPFHPLSKDATAMEILLSLARFDLHRVPVIGLPDRQVYNLVTQFQILEWLLENKEKLGFIENEKVGDNFNKQVVTKLGTDNVGLAFSTMIKDKISAVAVVDDTGKLVGNLSRGDLKGVGTDASRFWRTNQTIDNFLRNMKRDYPSHKKGADDLGRPRSIVTAKPSESLTDVMQKLRSNRIHRLYVVDEQKHPTGVITLQGIFAKIISVATSETS